MGEETLLDKVRSIIGAFAWKIFLWSIEMTAEEYGRRVYEQEKYLAEILENK